jgi:drug/metabolite transporter (DMT)-like permease
MQYQPRHWLALIFLSVVWGTSFFLIKNGLETFTWAQVAALRITISFLGTLPVLFFFRKHFQLKDLKYYFLVGLTGNGIPAFCFTFAQIKIDSGIAGVLNSLTPAFTFALGVLFFALPFVKWKLIGLLTALTGALFLVSYGSPGGKEQIWYSIPVFIATLSYATSGNLVKAFLQHGHPIVIGGVGLTSIGIPAAIYLFSTSFWELSSEPEYITSLSSILVLALFGTVLASILYFRVIQNTDALFGSLVAYLIPLVALIIGVWDGEIITFNHIIGMTAILSGIYMINSKRPFSFIRPKQLR